MAMQALLFLVALMTSAPNYDLKAICKPARDAALAEDRAGAYDQCLKEEQTARGPGSANVEGNSRPRARRLQLSGPVRRATSNC